jgi:hypothetical protein
VRSDILAKHRDARLIVYAIWTDKLFRDSRSQWDGGGLTDHRVVHLWDRRDISGSWLLHHLPGYRGNDWDSPRALRARRHVDRLPRAVASGLWFHHHRSIRQASGSGQSGARGAANRHVVTAERRSQT